MRALLILTALLTGCPASPDDTSDTEVDTQGDGTETPDPCEELTCDNGVCVADGNTASCDCDDGWQGDLCDEDIDECNASPCANDATCVNIDGSFTCECAAGWEGDLCDINTDDCPTADCGNGTCVDGIDAFTCDCDPGWQGDDCRTEIDECEADPCVNAVQCIDQLAAFTCVCQDGWQGDLCDEDINECADAPCDQGNCIDGIGEFTCDCDVGFDGDLCDNNIDDCQGVQDCVFGDCVDGIATFTCDCDDGWQGDLCDEDTNECDDADSCSSDSVCINSVGSFACEPVAMVDPARSVSGDGTTWQTAYATLQDAVDAGETSIWVKEGTLTPAGPNEPVLVVPEDVTIVGGFSVSLGNRDGSADARDPSARTVLSGTFFTGALNDQLEPSPHVVVGASGMTLDGIEIRDGITTSESGAGLVLIDADDVTLSNVVLTNNRSGVSAGGLYCDNSLRLRIVDSTIDGNAVNASGATGGGGIASFNCTADLVDSVVSDNQAVSTGNTTAGGGLWLQGGDWVLDGVDIVDNRAIAGTPVSQNPLSVSGGGLAAGGGVHLTGSPTLAWTDVVFTENTAEGGNGGRGSARLCAPFVGCFGGGPGGRGGAALGGGLFVSPGTTLTLIGGEATANTSTGGDGGTAVDGSGAVGGLGPSEGGGLYMLDADVDYDFVDDTFEANVPDAFRPCTPGFEGYLCLDNIDDCADDPCANAECIDATEAFICDCDPGWEGTLCDVDVDIDNCTADACDASEVCIDDVDSVTCEVPVFVSPTGNGTDGASWETAFTSLTAAFDAGAQGIWMKEGTYTAASDADVWIDVPGKARVYGGFASALTGQTGDVDSRTGISIVDGASRVQHVMQLGRGSVVDGLQIQGGSGSRFGGGVLIMGVDRVVLRNSTVRANSVTGDQVRAGGVYCDQSTEVVFDSVRIEDNSATGGQIVGGGMALYACTGRIENSRITGNQVTSNNNATGIGLAIVQGTFDVSDTVFDGNVGVGGTGATGGYGSIFPFPANGGGGGGANGGGAYIDSVEPMVWTNVQFQANRLTGGRGGTGAATQDTTNCFDAGDGGPGGSARGGGVYITPTSDVTLVSGSAVNNVLVAGIGGDGGAGRVCGSRQGQPGGMGGPGAATGGAVFATDSATVTLSPVSGNTELQLDLSR